ncbi:hypothetical protein BH09ACT10_BH09ACT10_16200 [soil metagenome]
MNDPRKTLDEVYCPRCGVLSPHLVANSADTSANTTRHICLRCDNVLDTAIS